MQKIQILFPDPVMRRLRLLAETEDRPVSELVRRAVERLLDQRPVVAPRKKPLFPQFHGGGVLIKADRMKEVLYEDDAL